VNAVNAVDAVEAVEAVEAAAGTIIGRRTGRVRRFLGIPFFFDVLDAPGTAEALGTRPPPELAASMHADLAAFVHGRSSAREPATGRLGDPAREYGRPGAASVADTAGMFDPVVPTGSVTAEAC
jgi:para-nitrobenzyl esterase